MVSFETEREAVAFADSARQQARGRSCEDAVDAYLAELERRGLKESTRVTTGYRLKAFLDLENGGARQLRLLTAARARALYGRRSATTKPDTHRNELATASAFADWCVKVGWLAENPFADVEPIGRRTAGKPQLRIDEARKYLEVALGEGTVEGVAAAMPLLMGLRASEVMARQVRDVDDGGRVLWIPTSKTATGVRNLEIPEVLRPFLAELTRGRAGHDLLFGDGRDRQWLYYHVTRIAIEAGVPWTTPHALRGLHSTIAVSAGMPVDHVARTLGHAHASTTRRHYLAAGAERAGGVARATAVLTGIGGELPATSGSPTAETTSEN